MRRQPTIVQYDSDELNLANTATNGGGGANNNNNNNNAHAGGGRSGTVRFDERNAGGRVDMVMTESGKLRRRNILQPASNSGAAGRDIHSLEDGPGKKMTLNKPLEVGQFEFLYVNCFVFSYSLPSRSMWTVPSELLPQTSSERLMLSSLAPASASRHSPPSCSPSCTGTGRSSGSARAVTTCGVTTSLPACSTLKRYTKHPSPQSAEC